MEGRIFTPWTVGLSIGVHAVFLLILMASPLARPKTTLRMGRTITIKVAPGLPARRVPPKAAPAAPARTEAPTKKLPSPVLSKKKPEAMPEKAAASPTPDASPAVALSKEPPGNGSNGADGTSVQGLDTAYFPFDYYVTQFLNRLSANWYKPPAPAGTSCIIRFTITKSGRIADAEVQTPSPYPAFDRAALRAVLSSNPLPPLPFEFNEDKLGVHLKFE